MDVWWYRLIFFRYKFHVFFQYFGDLIIKEMVVEGEAALD